MLENLLGAHFANVSFSTKEFLKVDEAFVVLSDGLAQEGRWHVARMVLRYLDHAFLGDVFGTAEQENTGWVNGILDKETGLVLVFGEILDKNARCDFKSELLNQSEDNCVVIRILESVLLNEIVEVKELSVGAHSKGLTDSSFT